MPRSRATSASRFEFEEFFEPITSSTSTRGDELLDGVLPVLGGVADVFPWGPFEVGVSLLEGAHDLAGLVDRQRGLGEVGERPRRELDGPGVLEVLHQDGPLRRLAARALDLLVAGVADQDDRPLGVGETPRLDVDLGHQRTGGVDQVEPSQLGLVEDARRRAVRRQHGDRALGHLVDVVDEDRALGLEIAHHVQVVDDLLAHVDRRAVLRERSLDRFHGPLDARAIAAGRGEEHATTRSRHAVMVAPADVT